MQKTSVIACVVTGILLSSTGAWAYYQSPAVREAREARKVSLENVEKQEEIEIEDADEVSVVATQEKEESIVSDGSSPSQNIEVPKTEQEEVIVEDVEEESEEREDDNRSDSITQPTQTPTTSSGYTLATVAQHATSSNCWSVVGGNVYDLTSWVSRHPGGSSSIVGMCGIDATSRFEGKHGGSSSAKAALVLLKIGALAN